MATIYWLGTTSTAWSTGANWSSGSVPSSSDLVVFDGLASGACTTGLSVAATGLTIFVDQSFAYQLGNVAGVTKTPLTIPGGTVIIGRDPTGTGSGSPFVYISSNTNLLTATVYKTAPAGAVSGLPPVVIEASSLTLNHTDGSVAVAPIAGTTTTAGNINVTLGSADASPTLLIGEGATVTSLTVSGGTVTNLSSNTTGTTVLSNGASYTVQGSGAHTTVTVGTNSTLTHRGSGGITTLNNEGTFDRTGDTRAITIGTTNAYGGATFYLDNGKASSITRTTLNLVNCGAGDLTVTTPIGERF